MIGHGHSRDFPIITFPPFYLCAAGIGRTAQADPGTGVPAQTACRETYGLLLYAVRSLHPTIRGGRSHLPHGTNRTPRTSQRCDPEGTFRGECSKAGEAVSKTAWVGSIPNCPCHRRDLLPRSRTERKPAKVVFPVRCTKAAGRIIIIWLAPAMNEETDATDVPAQG